MKLSAAVDLVGSYNTGGDEDKAKDRFGPRTVDFMAYGAIDPFFDGLMSMAAHQENGQSIFEIHEAFISSDRLIDSSKFRVGQFFLDIGRLSRTHQHEWPFISTPLIHKELFGNEGVLDSGVEYSYLLPLSFYLDVTLGLSNGFVWGHAHTEGEKPISPNQYIHVTSFMTLGDFDIQPGFSGLWRVDHQKRKEEYLGLELTAKKSGVKKIKWLSQTEIWQRTLEPDAGKKDITLGAYTFLRYSFNSPLSVGIRADYLTVTTLEDAFGKAIENYKQAISPQISYKPSEFSNFRIAYNLNQELKPDSSNVQANTIDFQTTFMLGAHPAHAF